MTKIQKKQQLVMFIKICKKEYFEKSKIDKKIAKCIKNKIDIEKDKCVVLKISDSLFDEEFPYI